MAGIEGKRAPGPVIDRVTAASPRPANRPVRPRGPNATRRASTRQKLLDATIECLFRYGYFGTSTVLVTEVAGVSRGSLLHQFPTKVDLMIATAEYIAAQRKEAHYGALAALEKDEDKFRALPAITWSELARPSGIARIELMLAARSDPAFAARMNPLNERLEMASRDAIFGLVARMGVTDRAKVDTMVRLYIATLRGLAIDGIFDHAKPHVEDVVALLTTYQDWLLETLKPQRPGGET